MTNSVEEDAGHDKSKFHLSDNNFTLSEGAKKNEIHNLIQKQDLLAAALRKEIKEVYHLEK